MNREDDTIFAEALRWHSASENDAMDWEGFTAWLEADPRHQQSYDAVALGSSLVDEHRHTLVPHQGGAANDDAPVHALPVRTGNWMRWGGAAIAASMVALLVAPQLTGPAAQTYRTVTTSREIALQDGSSVILAPHSKLEVAGRHQERLALQGGAWFDIRHDPARAMQIQVGDVEISDIGTRFDVQHAAGQVRVEVAQGVVSVGSAALGQPIRLQQGHGLTYNAKAGAAIVRPLGPEAIGEWRSGQLSFDSSPLSLVVADISRYAGVNVSVAPALRNRQFSGTLVIDDGEAAMRDLSRLMDVDLRRGAAGMELTEHR